MTKINYIFTLSADGYDTIELDVSSFSYRATSESKTGSLVIEGTDDSESISERAENGTLTLTKRKTGVDTEILTATIDNIDIVYGTTSNTINMNFTFNFSGSILGSPLVIDNLVSYMELSGGSYSFRLSEIQDYIQNGMSVEYDSIERYIDEINTQYNADSFGYVTLNEGDTETESVGTTCTFELENGVPYESTLGYYDCYQYIWTPPLIAPCLFSTIKNYGFTSIIKSLDLRRFLYIKYFNFTLAEESNISISVSSVGFSDMVDDWYSCDGQTGKLGFEAVLVNGEYTAFEDFNNDAFLRFGVNIEKNLTLPAGIYTLVLVNITLDDDPAVSFTIDYSSAVV